MTFSTSTLVVKSTDQAGPLLSPTSVTARRLRMAR